MRIATDGIPPHRYYEKHSEVPDHGTPMISRSHLRAVRSQMFVANSKVYGLSMSLRLNASGILEGSANVLQAPTANVCALENGRPEGVVWHWTGGPALGPAYATALAHEIASANPAAAKTKSWHFLVAKDGRIIQSAPTTKGTWHVGASGNIAGVARRNVNYSTVGIELENAGYLATAPDGFRCEGYPSIAIPKSRGVAVGVELLDVFPPAQVAAATDLLRAIVAAHRLPRDVCAYGHVMFDPKRRRDPGPLWLKRHLPAILDSVFGV